MKIRKHKTRVTTHANGNEFRCYYKNFISDDLYKNIPDHIANIIWEHIDHNSSSGAMITYWSFHRDGKPAMVMDLNGEMEYRVSWYAYGKHFMDTRDYCEILGYDQIKTMSWLLKYGDTLPERMTTISS